MHFLQREIERNEELAAAVSSVSEQAASNGVKQGLILDLNPMWLAAFRMQDSGLDPSLIPYWAWPDFRLHRWEGLIKFNYDRIPDLDSRFPELEEFFAHFYTKNIPGGLQPFLLRVAARPELRSDRNEDRKESIYEEERQQLIGIANEARIPTIVETHPPSSLLSSPGSRLRSSSGKDGTLGGYVKDRSTSSIFAMTCGHVVTGAAHDGRGNQIGVTVHSVEPTQLPATSHCHQHCGHLTELDVALIATHRSAPNVATAVANTLGNGQLVKMDGATTRGTPTYEIGGHVVEYEIGGFCWQNLVQFHAPTRGITPVSVNVATTPLPQPGDSGAWLIRNSNEWAGMVVASNSLFGLALSSTRIIEGCDSQFGTSLSLA